MTCRTAIWPPGLEEGLKKLLKKENVKVYEMAPLTRASVKEAVEQNIPEKVDEFFNEVQRIDATPFAISPITLEMLINIFSRDSKFPPTRAELYEKGLGILCEEPRSRTNHRSIESAGGERLAIASRIAAILVFSNHFAIYKDVDRGDVPDACIAIDRVIGGNEPVNGKPLPADALNISKALDTGLFSLRGPRLLGFTHKTFAEFLAARYILKHGLTTKQTMSLLQHTTGQIVPQLYETAAWLASMNNSILNKIKKSDPQVLLFSDLTQVKEKIRKYLVKILLKLYSKEKLCPEFENYRRYPKLSHSRLASQLHPYIKRKRKRSIARSIAINIAETCKVQSLQGDLARIALDESEPLSTRKDAAYAVLRIGDTSYRAKLKPLVIGTAGDDPQDELKGIGLKAVWPGKLSTQELIKYLTPPKDKDLFGSYYSFLRYDLINGLRTEDIPIILDWVKDQPPKHELSFMINDIIDQVTIKAWENIDEPGVLQTFAKMLFQRLKLDYELSYSRSENGIVDSLHNDLSRRRLILKEIISNYDCSENELDILVYSGTPLVLSDDITWMIEQGEAANNKDEKERWAQLVFSTYRSCDLTKNPGLNDLIITKCQENETLAKSFGIMIRPIDLDSDEASELKRRFAERQKWLNREEKKPRLEPPPDIRIRMLLEKFEAGDINAWWRLCREMTLAPNSTHYGDEYKADLTRYPGWLAADEATKQRIINAAQEYILHGDPKNNEWFGTNKWYRPAYTGYNALLLIERESPEFYSQIQKPIWRTWAHVIVAYPVSSGIQSLEPHLCTIKKVFENARDEFDDALLRMIDKENEEHGYVHIVYKVKHCWDTQLSNLLLAKVKDQTLKPSAIEILLRELLEHKSQEARQFAESLVTPDKLKDEKGRERAIVAAGLLMEHTDNAGWDTVWPMFNKDPEFSKQVVEDVSYRGGHDKLYIYQKLEENQLADFFVWFVRQYPYHDKKKQSGVVSAKETAEDFRDQIIGHLRDRGTPEAVAAIERLTKELPHLDWLKRTLLHAKEITLRESWTPLSPEQLRILISKGKRSLLSELGKIFEIKPGAFGLHLNVNEVLGLIPRWLKTIRTKLKIAITRDE